MADRLDYYFRQRVTEAELDLGFSLLEKALHNLAADLRIYGVVSGGVPSPHSPVPDLSIDLTAPARAYDNLGQRLFFGTGQTVDCSTDLSGIPTDVSTAGNERWLGVFLRFKRLLSDPRTDGNSQQVFFRRDESFELVVRQAAEGAAGAAPKMALQPDELLLCDVRRRPGQTQVVSTDIDTSRRQAFVFVQGSSVGITTVGWNALSPGTPTVQAALDAIDAVLTDHFDGTAHRHAATKVDYAPHGMVAATTVQGAIDELVDDLAGAGGSAAVGAGGVPGNPNPLGPGSVASQLGALLGLLNGHVAAVSDAHPASAISATPHSYITTTSVQAQLQSLVVALADQTAAAAGSTRIGSMAFPGAPVALVAKSVAGQLFDLLTAHNAHLNELFAAHPASTITVLDAANRLNAANTEDALAELMAISGADHFRANEAVPAGMHRTIRQPPFSGSTKALLWDAQGTGAGVARFRVYLDGDSLWLTMNASWNGTQWVKQATGNAAALRLGRNTFELVHEGTPATQFALWTRTWRLPIDSNAVNSAFELSGSVRETGYCGAKMYNPTGASQFMMLGNVVNFRSRFPAAPSSITLAVRDSSAGVPTTRVQNVTRDGFAFTIDANVGASNWSYWYGDYTAIA
ncbi:MAG: hypothetical protein IAE78_20290 [Myxococcus sp.]|nr:hypothetical protein [Myxococcus sp.]